MRRRLHILILAQGADSLLAQFYALRFEPLHPLGGAGKCAEPVETLAVGGLEIIIVDRFQERPAMLDPGKTRHAAKDSAAGVAFQQPDRKSVVEGKRVSVRVDLGGRRRIKKKKKK